MNAPKPQFGPVGGIEIDPESKKKLNGARWAMIIIGALMVIANIFLFMNAKEEVRQLAVEELRNGFVVDQQAALQMVEIIYGTQMGLGCVFVLLGVLVMRFPLLCTSTGLTIYIGSIAIFGVMDPTTLLKGMIFKVLIIVVLFQGIKTALNLKRSAGPF